MRKANIKKWIKLGVVFAVFATLLLLPQPVQYYTAYEVYGYGYSVRPEASPSLPPNRTPDWLPT